jgi:hypothetical protein
MMHKKAMTEPMALEDPEVTQAVMVAKDKVVQAAQQEILDNMAVLAVVVAEALVILVKNLQAMLMLSTGKNHHWLIMEAQVGQRILEHTRHLVEHPAMAVLAVTLF